jgi:transposase
MIMNRRREILWILVPCCGFFMGLFAWLVFYICMQDATSKVTIESIAHERDQLSNERDRLKTNLDQVTTKLAWYETEYRKLAAIIAAGNKRREKHVSHVGTPWLPFDSQEELDQARLEAETEAKKLVDDASASVPSKKKKPRKESLPQHLPEVKKLCDVHESQRVCPSHGPMGIVGYDTTETLVHEPAKLYRLVTEYPKYGCACCKEHGIKSAPRPTGLVEGNKYDSSVAAAVVVQKYDLHLPLYRQTDVFAASGWTPSRSTLQNLLEQVDFVMLPLVMFMTKLVQKDSAVGLDESSCRMLIPKETPQAKFGDLKTQRLIEKIKEARAEGADSLIGKMWAYRGLDQAPYNIFDFRISRHRDGPDEFFRESRCIVQGDCFSGNTSVVLQSDGRLEFAACWAHARRKVYEVSKENPYRSKLLDMIQGLYDVNARELGMDAAARTAHRQSHAIPMLVVIKKYIDSLTDAEVFPRSDMGAAVGYIRKHWEALIVYARAGRVPIDNNRVEQLMREVAIGRKNWLFVGNVESGERAARLMTIVSSAKRHHLDVGLYLKDVMDRLLAGQTDYGPLMPDIWKQSHPEAVRTYRESESRYKAERKPLSRAKRLLAAKAKHQQTARRQA